MQYQITHTTQYNYSRPVQLGPHILRLCPRQDGNQWLKSFHLEVSPQPANQTHFLDADNNTGTTLTFNESLTELTIQSQSDIYTTRSNPFNYLSEPWAVDFPLDYSSTVLHQLAPYLTSPPGQQHLDPAVVQLAHRLAHEKSGNVGYFLMHLTQTIPELCDYQQRVEGPAYTPGITLQKKSGTCRDFTVLFMAVCRAMGLAARFVSGYQQGDAQVSEGNDSAPSEQTTHDLHAWAEVYIPGGGWRGFDPTLGLAVADRHVAIAATAFPQQAAPVFGTLRQNPADQNNNLPPVTTQLSTDISFKVLAA